MNATILSQKFRAHLPCLTRGTSPNSQIHKCIHKISQTSKRCERELEYFFYRINVDMLRKLLGLVTYENRSPMSGHTFLSLLCFGFPSLSSFSDFPSFLNFPSFHTFLFFLFYPTFQIYAAFHEIFLVSHCCHHFWTLVLT